MKTVSPPLVVAVTGVGAIIGQGIVRSLRASARAIRIIGIDRNERSPGTYFADAFEKKPDVPESSDAYLEYWAGIVRKHDIHLVLPGLEVDMLFLDSQRRYFESLGVVLALNTPSLIAQTGNKWAFGESLTHIGYPTIPSLRPDSWKEAIDVLGDPPLLLKPLQGNGSRGIVRLEDETDFSYWRAKLAYPWMLQRIIGSADEEYTVGVFGLGSGSFVGPITFRRRLSAAGNTLEAEVVRQHPVIEVAVDRLCAHFQPSGPTNLQFRIEGSTAYLLEINPRFSSSNSLRTAFGFNEADMAIDYYLYNRTPDTPVISDGVAWRYSEDFVVHAGHSV